MKCIILVLFFVAFARSEEDCVPGWTYDAGANITQMYINGAWTLIRGRTTYHQGWIESELNNGPCIFYSSGMPDSIKLSVIGQSDFPVYGYHCYGLTKLEIEVPADAPLGPFLWKFIVSRNNEVNVTQCNYMNVIDVPEVPRQEVDKTNLTVPMKSLWEELMLTKGMMHCFVGECCYEGFAWYYDGVRVYRQIAEYTGNDTFMQCMEHHKYYFDFVLDSYGAILGNRVFPHGFYMEYLRLQDPTLLAGLQFLGNNSAFASGGGDSSAGANRETAYTRGKKSGRFASVVLTNTSCTRYFPFDLQRLALRKK